jgi:hypothetical protein
MAIDLDAASIARSHWDCWPRISSRIARRCQWRSRPSAGARFMATKGCRIHYGRPGIGHHGDDRQR